MNYKIKDDEMAEWLTEAPLGYHGNIGRAMYSAEKGYSDKAGSYYKNGYSLIKLKIFKSKLLQVMYCV